MKDCVLIQIDGMTEKEYAKLLKVVRRAFPENQIKFYTLRWEY
jgi:hypothetical protein